ncbi:MAG: helix-turn-helix domain-containing protein [Betaproteobacteria bacterium]|nr:helix-turn-helix domain-containing protein [Betaproteobacteria bacterium]
MDLLIRAAAQALGAGDALGALNRIARRDDAAALALRGVAMAQLGDLEHARLLLGRAVRGFGPRDGLSRARCVLAQAEIALVCRDLRGPARALEAARTSLAGHGDSANAAHAGYLQARQMLLLGRLDQAEQLLAGLDAARLAPPSRAGHALVLAGLAMRRLRVAEARAALARASALADSCGIASLQAEVREARLALEQPAARCVRRGEGRLVALDEVERIAASPALVVDACRHRVLHRGQAVALASRPVLFALAHALAEAWPGDVPRNALLLRVFRARQVDDSHRARLRVELARLRAALRGCAGIRATRDGFALEPAQAGEVVVLEPPTEGAHAELLSLLADGQAWSSSALAIALGLSQRSLQRALQELAGQGKARPVGQGRARRWTAEPVPGFPTSLLLPGALIGG